MRRPPHELFLSTSKDNSIILRVTMWPRHIAALFLCLRVNDLLPTKEERRTSDETWALEKSGYSLLLHGKRSEVLADRVTARHIARNLHAQNAQRIGSRRKEENLPSNHMHIAGTLKSLQFLKGGETHKSIYPIHRSGQRQRKKLLVFHWDGHTDTRWYATRDAARSRVCVL